MVDRVEFQGPRGQVGYGLDAAQVNVAAQEPWCFVQVIRGVVQVWTAAACRRCVVQGRRVVPCELHKSCTVIARALEMKGAGPT